MKINKKFTSNNFSLKNIKAGKIININLMKWILLFISVLIVAFPLYATFVNSFKHSNAVLRNPFALPLNFTFDNYKYIFSSPNVPLFEMYKNTILITSISLGLILFTAPLAGYYLARTSNKISKYLTIFFLAGLMVPRQITLVPLVNMFVSINLIGKLSGMYVFYLGNQSVLAVFMYSRFIKTIPYSLEESALIDGANSFQIFWRIIFPLLKPITATMIVFIGFFIWNDFMTPLLLLKGTLTITMGIYSAIGPYSAEWGRVFAFVIVSAFPMLMLFAFFQSWFIKGLTSGAVKS